MCYIGLLKNKISDRGSYKRIIAFLAAVVSDDLRAGIRLPRLFLSYILEYIIS